MTRLKKYSSICLSLILFAAITSCNPGSDEVTPETAFKEKISTLEMENFKVPDSINTALIAASYYESDPEGHTLIVYHNGDRKAATRISYQADGSVLCDSLELIRFNEFRSKHYNMEYVINKTTVSSIYKEKSCTNFASMSGTKEYPRLDTNLAATAHTQKNDLR